jgi:hypothetical protein
MEGNITQEQYELGLLKQMREYNYLDDQIYLVYKMLQINKRIKTLIMYLNLLNNSKERI